jgi:SARP family transcriptional regulator, regulator of embCAB operon
MSLSVMAEQMRFGILGALRIQGPEGLVAVTGAKRRILLTALLAHANRVVPVDKIVEWLWPRYPPRSAAGVIQAHVSALRHQFEPHRPRWGRSSLLLTQPGGYLVQVTAEQLDALDFEELVQRGGQALRYGRAVDASRVLREALDLWRGEPLAEATAVGAAQAEVARLEELRLTGVMLLTEAELALGHHLELVPELSRLVLVHPLHEPFYAQLMAALAASDRRADALRVYDRAREVLARELSVEPGPGLRRVRSAILTDGNVRLGTVA